MTTSTDPRANARTPRHTTRTRSTQTRSARRNVASVAIVGLMVPGLFATAVLPAYAQTPGQNGMSETAVAQTVIDETQTLELADPAAATALAAVARDDYSVVELPRPVVRPAAVGAGVNSTASVRAALANPPYPNFSLDSVVSVGLQYVGVPYRFGGSDPSGFDCSGFTQFVYAQFGIALPHSVRAQASLGTVITAEAAQPGDLVVLSDHSHIGIWMGNGMILDAPYAGKSVTVRPIWTSSYYLIRVGI